MEVTKINEISKYASKIYVDYEHTFTLYNKDISKLNIYEGKEISELEYHYILDELMYSQAKSRALKILERASKTEHEMKDKLKQKGYTEYVIEKVVKFLKEYSFIDDNRYATNFVRYNSTRKSKRQIECELIRKGIDKLIVAECLGEYDDETEGQIISKYLEKYRTSDGTIPADKFNKIAASLYRKGFKNSTILKKMRDN